MLNNNIIANSTPGDCFVSSASISGLNNWIQDGSCGAFFSGDPKLGPLQNNYGTTQTHTPSENSPVIDAIATSNCMVPSDQRLVTRLQGAGCDIGSVEATPVISIPTATSTITC
jgi:hypothetical protein